MGTITTIKNRRDFLSASARGQKAVTGSLILQALKRAEDHPVGPEPRIGYTVTKKMGNAVARNRIKRRLREAVRKAANAAQGHDYVVISRPKALACDFAVLVRDMEFAFSRITVKKDASQE